MSCLKMYMLEPKAKGIPCPEGCTVVRYKGEEDIPAWIDICKDGENSLIDPNATYEEHLKKFRGELLELDGPDPLRDTYFIEYKGEKVATITVVPNMWSTGMGYIHMVACKQKCRGSLSFTAQQLHALAHDDSHLAAMQHKLTIS